MRTRPLFCAAGLAAMAKRGFANLFFFEAGPKDRVAAWAHPPPIVFFRKNFSAHAVGRFIGVKPLPK